MLFTLPFWQERLTRVRFVGSFRHPRDVAGSLRARNHMPREDALKMWASYNRRMLAYLELHEFPLVSFDVTAEEYLRAVDRVADHLRARERAAAGRFFVL